MQQSRIGKLSEFNTFHDWYLKTTISSSLFSSESLKGYRYESGIGHLKFSRQSLDYIFLSDSIYVLGWWRIICRTIFRTFWTRFKTELEVYLLLYTCMYLIPCTLYNSTVQYTVYSLRELYAVHCTHIQRIAKALALIRGY